MNTHRDRSIFDAATKALKNLEPDTPISDKHIVKSLVSQIYSLKESGVKYKTIYDTLVKSVGLTVSFKTFVVYAQDARLKSRKNSTDKQIFSGDNFSQIPDDEPVVAKMGRF